MEGDTFEWTIEEAIERSAGEFPTFSPENEQRLLAELARLRADAAFKQDIVNILTECRRKCPHPISSVHFASVVGHAVLIHMNKQGCGDPYYA